MTCETLPPLYDLPPAPRLRGYRKEADRNDFPHAPEVVFEVWLAVVARQPRTRCLAVDRAAKRTHHVQHTQWLRFVDSIRAEVVDLGSDRTGIAIDSRSRFALWDFRVNRRRVERWLTELRAALASGEGNDLGSALCRPVAGLLRVLAV